MIIDNYALSTFQSCPAKYDLRMRERWTTRRKSAALGFGAAIHAGLAAWYKTGEIKQALMAIDAEWPAESPSDDYRTKAKCIEVMMDYVRKYPSESFKIVEAGGERMIEQTFTLATGLFLDCSCRSNDCIIDLETSDRGTVRHCTRCGEDVEPIEYGGIFDGLVEFDGSVYVLEHKSTSVLGSYYFDQFKPNNQISGYVWAAGLLSGMRVGGAIINALGVYKASATKFERQITGRSQEDIAEWLLNLRDWCQRIRDCERNGFFALNTQSCNMYGKCEFHSVHVLSNPRERELRLETDFVKETWSFEDRDG